MSAVDIFYLVTGLIFAASVVTMFILKRLWIGLALFGLGWTVMVVKDLTLSSEMFDLLIHTAMAAVFFVHAAIAYRKGSKLQDMWRK